MGKCKHHGVCGLEDANQPDGYLCILHSPDLYKGQDNFRKALETHCKKEKGSTNFGRMVFPYQINFYRVTFSEWADFSWTEFKKGAIFDGVTFQKGANFALAKFFEDATFVKTTFSDYAWFNKALFAGEANFWDASFSRADFRGAKFEKNTEFGSAKFSDATRFHQTEFKGEAHFSDASFDGIVLFSSITFPEDALFDSARFIEQASFRRVSFTKDANFTRAIFSKEGEFLGTDFNKIANFADARFLGPTIFTGSNGNPVFLGEAIFTKVISNPGDALRFIEADLSRCRFLGTDVRKVHFLGVRWARIGGRDGIYDEIAPQVHGEEHPLAQIEELYRELKQNYEDRRDYERAGDFHVGEKEIRLRNPKTDRYLKLLLALYKLVSGYGENYRRPLLWLGILWVYTSTSLLAGGLTMQRSNESLLLSLNSLPHWGWALLYGLKTIFHLPANDFAPEGLFGHIIHALASILGPVLIALFGLALRQRLKR